MPRQSLLTVTLAAALIGAGCATTPGYSPFKIDQEDFYARVKTVAVAPVEVPADLEDPEPVRAKFISLLEANLREAGFSVVPSREYKKVWDQKAEQIGGYFDRITGKLDESKLKTVREQTLRDMSARFGVHASLYPSIAHVRAKWTGNMARWDGTSESTTSLSGVLGFLLAPRAHGTTSGLSLLIVIRDTNDTVMYSNAGGIQLSAKVRGTDFVPVPPSDLFANEERNTKAVNIALGPLLGRSGSADKAKVKP